MDNFQDPEAGMVARASDQRRIADMTRESERLRPTPKPSTTSLCSGGIGALTPERTSDTRHRNAEVREIHDNSLEVRAQRYVAEYRAQKAAEENDERRRIEEQNTRVRRDDELRQAAIDRRKKRRELEEIDQRVNLALAEYALSPAERAAIYQTMVNTGRFEADYASSLACKVVNARGTTRVNDAPIVDWRDGVTGIGGNK